MVSNTEIIWAEPLLATSVQKAELISLTKVLELKQNKTKNKKHRWLVNAFNNTHVHGATYSGGGGGGKAPSDSRGKNHAKKNPLPTKGSMRGRVAKRAGHHSLLRTPERERPSFRRQ